MSMHTSRAVVGGLHRLLTGLSLSSPTAAARTTMPVCRRHLQSRACASSSSSSWMATLRGGALSGKPLVHARPVPLLSATHSLQRSFASDSKGEEPTPGGDDSAPLSQHGEWVEFQKSIAVEGFETGQALETQKKNKRGGKRIGKRKSKETIRLEARLAERQRMTSVGSGEFPPLRYSDEETERLLAQAYAAIPPRAGKRGTRNLKRQKRRWWLVRQIRKKYKKNIIRHHFRRMAERSRVVKAVRAIKAEAPAVCQKDRAYQMKVFDRWHATMTAGARRMAANRDDDGSTDASSSSSLSP